MIKIDNLSYSFPQKDLFNNISFTIEEGQHCAFIGTSGSGKSTLIDMIMDQEQYLIDGKLEIDKDCRIGFVSQFSQPEKSSDTTVFEFIAQEFIILQNQITSICHQMETSQDIDPLLTQYQLALDTFEALGGDDFESEINKKLNLSNLLKTKDSKVSNISGGEFKLIQVIKEMLKKPNLMIMDEPDVFLDFENLNSLKNLINSYKGMLLIVTHNRFLLNHCFNKIIHLENKQLQEFNGSYVEYNANLLLSKIELQELAIADEEEIAKNEILIDKLRFIASVISDASRDKTLKARVRSQERLEARKIKAPFVYIKQPNIRLSIGKEPEESTILSILDYSVSFADLLLEKVSFDIKSTDKVAIIGLNGTGKTTLLRDIYKNNHPAIHLNKDVEVGYLSQAQGEMLNDTNTILDEFFESGFEACSEIITYASNFGFEEEILSQKIGSLSGGERNMLQIAKVCAKKANLLLLDEPTSHLDTYSQIALENALSNFSGAVLMVSHDYYTISNSMDYVLFIENKTIRRMSIKNFRKLIYANHFDKNYLDLENKKKTIETKIELALNELNLERAKILAKELEDVLELIYSLSIIPNLKFRGSISK